MQCSLHCMQLAELIAASIAGTVHCLASKFVFKIAAKSVHCVDHWTVNQFHFARKSKNLLSPLHCCRWEWRVASLTVSHHSRCPSLLNLISFHFDLTILQALQETNCLLKVANYFCIIPLAFGKIWKGCFRICECVTFRLLQTNFEIYARPLKKPKCFGGKRRLRIDPPPPWRFSLNNKYHTL